MGLINGVLEKNQKIGKNMATSDDVYNYILDKIGEEKYKQVSIVDNSVSKRKTDDEIKISFLTDANKTLNEEYSALLKKTTIILEAYKKLESENEELKSKLGKRESVTKTVENSKNYLKNIWNDFIYWLNS